MKKNRPPTQRQLRVGEELRHALVEVFERDELRDPILRDRAITFSEVRLGSDLRSATVFISPLGGGDADEIVEALSRAASFLRGAVAKRVQLRYMPSLNFAYDESFDQADRIDALLRRPAIARDLISDGEEGGT
jgi:ribosome-binding factor A